jgi:uncharacterized protein YihD (DUF1040 family)
MDISRLVIEIQSAGVVQATGNMDAFIKSMRLSEQETAKLESTARKYNESIDYMNSTLRSLDQQLIKTKKEQDSLSASMKKLVDTGGSEAEIQKLAAEISKLDTEIKKIQDDKILTSILKDYETKFKSVSIETKLFGESLATLKQKQDITKTALVDMIESGVNPAAKEVSALKRQYLELAGQIDKTQKNQQDMSQKFIAFQLIVNKLPGPLRSIASGLMGMVSPATAAVSAFLELGGAVIQFGKDSLQAFGEFELIRSNLELTMGSAKEAKRVFSDVKDFAMKTPFDVAGTAQAVNMLKQAGVATKDLISTVEMLGNVSGGSMERFNRISYNYVQVLQKGILDARDTREFAGNLVPINKALEAIGVTGKATSDDMVKAFQYMTREGGMFYDAMFKQSDTLVGKTNQMKEAWQNFKAAIAESTGFGQFWKDILDSQTEALQRNTIAINANMEARKARKAIESGEDTAQNRYQQYSNELIVIENQIKNFENQSGGRRDAEIIQLDMLYKKRKDILDLLEPYKSSVENLAEREESRTTELENQRKLIADGAKIYDEAISSVNERFNATPEGKLEALQKILEKYEREYNSLLAVGRPQEVENLQEFGPGNRYEVPIRMIYKPPTEEEKNRYKAAIEALKQEINESLEKMKAPLKAWQIELGKIFNFTPTAETKGLPTVTKYIGDLSDTSERLSAVYGNKTIADMLGISELDQADDRVAEIQDKIHKMLTSFWTVDNESIKIFLDELNQAVEDRNIKYDNDQYKQYLDDLDYEYTLLGKSNEEREKAIFLGQLDRDGITDKDHIDELLEKWQKNRNRKSENDYQYSIENLKQEIEYARLGTYEAERQNLAKQYSLFMTKEQAEQEARNTVELKKQLEVLNSQDEILTKIQQQKEEAISQGNIGEYAAASAKEKGYGLIEGSDVGTFVQTTALTGSWEMGLIEMFLQALAKVVGGLDGVQSILNPVTESLAEFSPVLKSILLPLLALERGIVKVSEGMMWTADFLTGGLFSSLEDTYDLLASSNDERQKEEERIRALNEQYVKLAASMKEQEEYYLQQKRHLNAEHMIENYNVNDAVITPRGVVYTNPDDFIIATRKPETLGGGGASAVNVIINNYADAVIEQTETVNSNRIREIMINVKNYIANDIANGGMDMAFNAMNQRRTGRRQTQS